MKTLPKTDPFLSQDGLYVEVKTKDQVSVCSRTKTRIPPKSSGRVYADSLARCFAAPTHWNAMGVLTFHWYQTGCTLPVRCMLTYDCLDLDATPGLKEHLAKMKDNNLEFRKVDIMAVANFDKLVGKCLLAQVQDKGDKNFDFGVLCQDENGKPSCKANHFMPKPFEDEHEVVKFMRQYQLLPEANSSFAVLKVEKVLHA